MSLLSPITLRFTLCLSLLAALAPLPAGAADRAPSCQATADRALTYFQSLRDAQGRVIQVVGDHRCAGGPYLLAASAPATDASAPLVKLVPGWWLHEFVSARWLDAARTALQVRARYVTGVGPSGAEPFAVQVIARRVGERWQVAEPERVEAGFDLPTRQADGLIRIESVEQHRNLNIAVPGLPGEAEVDFALERLVIKSRFFGSATERITGTWVRAEDGGYRVGFDTDSPRVGVAMPKVVMLWWRVPNDGKPVRIDRSGGR